MTKLCVSAPPPENGGELGEKDGVEVSMNRARQAGLSGLRSDVKIKVVKVMTPTR